MNHLKFLINLIVILELKRKRSLDNQYKYLSDKKYNNKLDSLNKKYNNFYEINPEVDPTAFHK